MRARFLAQSRSGKRGTSPLSEPDQSHYGKGRVSILCTAINCREVTVAYSLACEALQFMEFIETVQR